MTAPLDRNAPLHPYYTAPEHVTHGDTGPRLLSGDALALTVGSDLVLTLGLDTETDAWTVHAHDSDGNWLAALATVPSHHGYTAALSLLPLAVGTARALFPNYLHTVT